MRCRERVLWGKQQYTALAVMSVMHQRGAQGLLHINNVE